MKTLNWTQLKALTLTEIREGECLKVTGDSEMVFYVTVHPEQVMRLKVEGLCGLIDKSRGF